MSKRGEKTVSMKDRFLVRLLGNERWQAITIPVFAILLSLIAAAIVILLVGKNPLTAFQSLMQGSGLWPKASYAAKKSMLTDFMSFLDLMTPMLFAALAVAVAFKAGLFNIGVSGQMLCAGFAATAAVGYLEIPGVVAKPLVVLIGIVVGALVGGLIGFLKYRFNINEVVSSIMLNYIAQYVISFLIYTNYVDPVSRQSRYVLASARLTLADTEIGGLKMNIPLGFILALIAVAAVKFLMDKTRLGYELKTVGANSKAARYAGINVKKSIVASMMISGCLAGLAGVTYYLGYYASIGPRTLASTGFDAIAVSLLGNSNPVGILFSSFLITAITKGSTYMSSTVGVPQEIASVVTGLILLFSACGAYIQYMVKRSKDRMTEAQAEQHNGKEVDG
ncbi:ABC transporter permease [Angelakisella massiliensis]|uniref:ABC transporter permease n=1 Tax=Angelakisella massiliensis TaxID=1871018 RepID=UPI000AD4312B|nr:ABC transporter permease [Angelakisella massiliensis]